MLIWPALELTLRNARLELRTVPLSHGPILPNSGSFPSQLSIPLTMPLPLRFPSFLAGIACLVSLPLPAAENRAPSSLSRPNIIFIFIDDMGFADPSCFGNPLVRTPRIDRLADEGLKLMNFYVNSPICSPSRVAVTTGQYPSRWKIHSYLNSRANNAKRGMADYLEAGAPTTARKLQAAGYATAHFGKWHMGGGRDVDDAPLPTEYGFDETCVAFEGLGDRILTDPKEPSAHLGHGRVSFCEPWEKTSRYTDLAIDFIRRHRDGPFYVRLFPNDVHDPHTPQPGTAAKWETVTKNHYEQSFFAVLEALDVQIGRLVDEVDALGIKEKTLIVFTSDNGPTDWPKYYQEVDHPPGFTGPYFGRKWSLFEGGIHVPFIARFPGTVPAGMTDATSVMSGIDLSPTLCAFAGVEAPGLDGVDRSGVLRGNPAPYPKPLFWQYGTPHAQLRPGKWEHQSPSFAVREGPWKLLVNPDGSESRLYHLIEDPGEKDNRLTSEAALAKKLQQKIKAWSLDVGLAFDGEATLVPPQPGFPIRINGQWIGLQNHGGAIEKSDLRLDGKSWLSLGRHSAPDLAGSKAIRLSGNFEAIEPGGVILAQGGDKTGYALHVKNGKLVFVVTADWKRTELTGPNLTPGRHTFEAVRSKEGRMTLQVDGVPAGTRDGAGIFAGNPGDSLEIGADLVKPVGEYEVPNAFHGILGDLQIQIR